MGSLRSILVNITPKGRLILAGSAIGVIVFTFFMLRLASAPSYTTVLAGHRPEPRPRKVTSALDEKGVKYEIQNNGTAIAVDKSQKADRAHRARREGPARQRQQAGHGALRHARSSAPATSSSR